MDESNPDVFSEWFATERGTEVDYDIEDDVDDVEEDDYGDE